MVRECHIEDGQCLWVCGQGLVVEHFKGCFTVLVRGSGAWVEGIQMLCDTEFGWRAPPPGPKDSAREMSQAGAGAGMLVSQCLCWKLVELPGDSSVPQAWANDLCLQ